MRALIEMGSTNTGPIFDDSVVGSTSIQNRPTAAPVNTPRSPQAPPKQTTTTNPNWTLKPDVAPPPPVPVPEVDLPDQTTSFIEEPLPTPASIQVTPSENPSRDVTNTAPANMSITPTAVADLPELDTEPDIIPEPKSFVPPPQPPEPPTKQLVVQNSEEPKSHLVRNSLVLLILLFLISGSYFSLKQLQKNALRDRLKSEASLQSQIDAMALEAGIDKLRVVSIKGVEAQFSKLLISNQTKLEGDLIVAGDSNFTSPVTITVSDETALTVNGNSVFNGSVNADSFSGAFSGTGSGSFSGSFAGTHTGSFRGNGSGLTNVNADLLDGNDSTFYLNASNLNAGTISDARLSNNVALRDATNTFTANNTFTQPVAGVDAINANELVTLGQLTTVSAGNYFLQNGNSYGTTAILGTNDAYDLQIETGGTTKLTIQDSTGNVGIGTTSPGAKLTVIGADNLNDSNSASFGGASSTGLTITNAGNGLIGTTARASGSGERLIIAALAGQSESGIQIAGGQNNGGGVINATTDSFISGGGLRFYTYTGPIGSEVYSSRMVILGSGANAGNIGIGNTSPQQKLHVKGTSLRIEESDVVGRYLDIVPAISGAHHRFTSNSSAGYQFENSGGQLMQLNVTGLNIGTGAPSAKLTFPTATTATGGIAFGSDTNLYRSTADTLRTNDALIVDGTLTSGLINGQTISSSANFTGTLAVASLGTTNTATFLCRNASNQLAGCNTTGTGAAFVQGGNSFGATGLLGTADANDLQLITGGAAKLTILNSNGNVGIGTANPTSKLHLLNNATTTIANDVTGTANAAAIFAQNTSNGNYTQISAYGSTTAASNFLGLSRAGMSEIILNPTSSGVAAIGTSNATSLVLGTSNAERLRISSTGNVGIGNTSPGNKLSVNTPATADSNAQALIGAGANGNKGLVVQQFSASQTASLFEVQKSDGTSYLAVDNIGRTSITAGSTNGNGYFMVAPAGTTGPGGTMVYIKASGGSVAPLVIEAGTSAGSNDMFIQRDSGGNKVFGISATGAISAVTGIASSGGYVQSGSTANTLTGTLAVTTLGTTNTATHLCRNASNQIAGCNTTGTGAAFVQGGNSFGATGLLGTADANDLQLITGGAAKLTILNSSGNVGIGITPTVKFHVSASASGSQAVIVNGGGLGFDNNERIFFKDTGGTYRTALVGSSGDVTALRSIGTGGTVFQNVSGNQLGSIAEAGTWTVRNSTATTGVTRLAVQEGAGQSTSEVFGIYASDGTTPRLVVQNGSVGIGTASPGTTLDVVGTIRSVTSGEAASGSRGINLISSTFNGTHNITGYSNSGGRLQVGTSNTGGVTSGNANVSFGSGGTSSDIRFATSSNSVAVERVRIDTSGNVGIQTTSPIANFQVSQSTSGIGTVATNGSTTLTGTGTQFLNTFKVGDTITVSGETVRTIATIPSNTSLTVTVAFSTTTSSLSYTLTGGDRLVALGNGSVGIGTTAPTQKLEVAGVGATRIAVNDTTDGVQVNLSAQSGSAYLYTVTNHALNFATNNGTAQATLLTSGNFGIGTTNPLAKLHVNVGTNQNFWLRSSSSITTLEAANDAGNANVQMDLTALNFRFNIGPNPAVTILNSGNVGIGTSPSVALHVARDGGASVIEIARFSNTNSTSSQNLSFDFETNKMITLRGGSASGGLRYVMGSTGEVFRIDNTSGSVGVGTATPTSFKLEVAGNIGPEADNTRDLGSASRRWANIYGNNIISSGSLTTTGHLLPSVNDTYDLGSNTLRWRDIYLGGETMHIGTSTTDEATFGYNTTSNILQIGTDSTSNGDIAFFTDNLYLDKSSASVGIGTTGPLSKLHVAAGDIALDLNQKLILRASDPTSSFLTYTTSGSQRTNLHGFYGLDFTTQQGQLYVTQGGLVGVGTSAPDTRLEVTSSSSTYWGQTTPGTWNNATAPSQALTITNSYAGGYDSTLVFRQATSTGVVKTAGAIDFMGTGSWTNGTVGTQTSDMLFILRDTADTLQERMRITSAGNVAIGQTTAPYKLTVNAQGNTGVGAQALHGQYYGTFISTESTSSSYYALNVTTGATANTPGTGTSALYVRADGNVGIGTAAPTLARLQVESTTNTVGLLVNNFAGTGSASNALEVSFGSSTAQTAVTLRGVNVDYTLNFTPLTGAASNIAGYRALLPALTESGNFSHVHRGYVTQSNTVTNSGTGTFTYRGIEVSTGGSGLVQNTVAGAIVWTGVDITMPTQTQTTGTVTSTGIKITGGTVNSGTTYALTTTQSAGNVGIGTATPTSLLHTFTTANSSINFQSTNSQTVYISRGGTGNYGSFILNTGGVSHWAFGLQNDSSDNFFIGSGTTAYDTGTAPKFTITPGGNVGIGLSPSYRLDVSSSSSTADISTVGARIAHTDSGNLINQASPSKIGLKVDTTFSGTYTDNDGSGYNLNGIESSPVISGDLTGLSPAVYASGAYFNPSYSGTALASFDSLLLSGTSTLITSSLGSPFDGTTVKSGHRVTISGAAQQNIGYYATVSGATSNYGAQLVATGTATSNYGISAVAAGAGTTNYAAYLGATGGSTNYNVYASGTALNYFGGNVGIGVTPSYKLDVSSSNSTADTSTVGARIAQTDSGNVTNIDNLVKNGLKVDATFSGTYSDSDNRIYKLNGIESSPVFSGIVSGAGPTAYISGAYFNPSFTGQTPNSSDEVYLMGTNTQISSNLGTGASITSKIGSYIDLSGTAQENKGVLTTVQGGVTNYGGYFQAVNSGSNTGVFAYGSSNSATSYGLQAIASGSNSNIGVYSNSSGGSSNYNFWAEGTGVNYFGGNVGIGINAPLEELHVRATSNAAFAAFQTGSNVDEDASSLWRIGVPNDGSFGLDVNTSAVTGFASTSRIWTALASGNVGIGETAPSAPLDIKYNGAGATGLRVNNVHTTGSAITFHQNGSYKGAIANASAWMGSGTDYDISLAANTGLGLKFFVNGSTTASMLVTSAGDVGVGKTPVSRKFEVAGDIRVGTGTTGCVEDNDGTLLAGACVSDANLKTNIESVGSVLDRFSQLRPVTFNWNDTAKNTFNFGNTTQTGVIAQEVEALFPELVITGDDGYKKVMFNNLDFYTIQAIKELKVVTDTLSARVSVLEAGNFGHLSVSGNVQVNGNLAVVGVSDLSEVKLSRITSKGPQAQATLGANQTGSVDISGNDVAGTVTYAAGNGVSSGEVVSINFSSPYITNPKVALTPKGSSSAQARYYVETTTTGFKIYFLDTPDPNTNYAFDYILVQ